MNFNRRINIIIGCIFVLLSIMPLSAEIICDSIFLPMNYDLTFTPEPMISEVSRQRSVYYDGNDDSGFDISASNDCPPANDCCSGFNLIGSQKMYYIEQTLDEIDFGIPLDIENSEKFLTVDYDTSIFPTVGTVIFKPNIDGFFLARDDFFSTAYYFCDSNCDYSGDPNRVLLIGTESGNYALIGMKSISAVECTTSGANKTISTCLDGIYWKWYLQTDGTLDFSGMQAFVGVDRISEDLNRHESGSTELLFRIDGHKMISETRLTPGLYFYVDPDGVLRKRMVLE